MALLVAGMIFASAAALTVIASLLPSTYLVFVAPLAVAAEVLFVTLVRQDRIFPVGAGQAGIALFAAVIVAAIALAVMLPGISAWMRQVEILWQFRVDSGIIGQPITYLGPDGRQYVAIVVGEGGFHARSFAPLVPEIQSPPNRGATVWVFALPR